MIGCLMPFVASSNWVNADPGAFRAPGSAFAQLASD